MRYNRTMLAENRLNGIIHNAVRRVLRENADDYYLPNLPSRNDWGGDWGDFRPTRRQETTKASRIASMEKKIIANIEELKNTCDKAKNALNQHDYHWVEAHVDKLAELANSINKDEEALADVVWSE